VPALRKAKPLQEIARPRGEDDKSQEVRDAAVAAGYPLVTFVVKEQSPRVSNLLH
jgi:hypothetical protein